LGPGFASELAAWLLESRYTGRLTRIGTPPVPIPAARSREAEVLPGEDALFQRLASFVTAD